MDSKYTAITRGLLDASVNVEKGTAETPHSGSHETAPGGDQRDSQRYLTSLNSANWWSYEVLSLLISSGAISAMIILLSKLQNKPQPSWAIAGSHCMTLPGSNEPVCRGVGISVNSVVSWLGTIARMCLLVPLSNGLGQLKWTWFSDRERSLTDISIFDAASRGASGSVQLIWRLKARYLATFGALGMILSVAFDPFVQNLVGYHTEYVLDPTQIAYVSNNSIFDGQYGITQKLPTINRFLKRSILDALYSSDRRQVWSEPQHFCSTGNCTWPPTASIGMCTSCRDTTHSVEKSCKHDAEYEQMKCNLTLPASQKIGDNTTLTYTYTNTSVGTSLMGKFFSISSGSNKGSGVKFEGREIASIYLDLDPRKTRVGGYTESGFNYSIDGPTIRSSNCTISPCVQGIRSVYRQSTSTTDTPFKEEILKTWPIDYNYLVPVRTTLFAPEYGAYNQTFSIERRSFDGMNNFFDDAFNGGLEPQSAIDDGYYTLYGDERDAIYAIWNSNYTGHNCTYKDNRVSCAMELVSKAISKTFRDQPWVENGTQGTAGVAYSSVIFVRVTWYWITLPICVWVLALCTFLGTAWKSSKPGVHVWRNNSLPLAFMKLHEDGQEADGVSQQALSKRAERMRGKLRADLRDIEFVGSTVHTEHSSN